MKVAVLADIHGNLPALCAVMADIDAWRPDRVVVAGDVINRGPKPAECWQRVCQRRADDGWQLIYGNHEEYVLAWTDPATTPTGAHADMFRVAEWTCRQLDGHIQEVRTLPVGLAFASPDGREVRVRHGSMLGTSSGILPRFTADDIRARMQPPPALFVVAHTHWPLVRRVDDTLVVNTGAVGLPFDGDSRASYARLEWRRSGWRAEIVRLPYDRAQTERDFTETGFIVDSGPLAELMLIELQQARSQLFQWTLQFESRITAGALTMRESVDQFLAAA